MMHPVQHPLDFGRAKNHGVITDTERAVGDG